MAKDNEQVVEEILTKIEMGGEVTLDYVDSLAERASRLELEMRGAGEKCEHFHRRVKGALEAVDAEKSLQGNIDYAITLLGSELVYEEDLQLASILESIGALLFFEVNIEEERRVELLDAFDEFLSQRRRRGEFKEAFLDYYRHDMKRLAELPVMSTMIHMMDLEHLVFSGE